MTIFELMGKIVIDNAQANKAIDDTNDNAKQLANSLNGSGSGSVSGMASSMGTKVANAASKVGTTVANAAKTVGKVALAGTATAAASITALTKQAVSAYADHEQLVGGVETLFKDSADTVKGYADEAYKTAGLSANAYMETVTSFSASLLQSLEWDTAAAADLANQAVIDMSDNANKMGTDMSMIQNAYQGFAKQNYTLLDNLKLGYGGTQQEMYRLLSDAQKLDETFNADFSIDASGHLEAGFADIIEAIHIIQSEMDITGTTALEAKKTISGSWSSLKGSFQNLLVEFAKDDGDIGRVMGELATSTATFFSDNLIPRIGEALGGIKDAVPEIAAKLVPAISEIISSTLDLVGVEIPPEKIQTTFTNIFGRIGEFVQNTPTIFEPLTTALSGAFENVMSSLEENGIDLNFDSIMTGIETAFSNASTTLAPIIEGLGNTISENVEPAINTVQNFLAPLQDIAAITFENIQKIDWKQIFEDGKNLAGDIADAFTTILENSADAAKGISEDWASVDFNKIFGGATGILGEVSTLFGEIAGFAVTLVSTLASPITSGLGALITSLQTDGTLLNQTLGDIVVVVEGYIQHLQDLFATLDSLLKKDYSGVASGITTMTNDLIDNNLTSGWVSENQKNKTVNKYIDLVNNSPLIVTPSKLFGDNLAPTGNSIDDPYGVMNLNADGAIYSKATIFGRAAGKLQVAGEAGAEAVAPIDVLQGYVSDAVASQLVTPQAAAAEITAESAAAIVETLHTEFDRLITALNNVGIKINNREFGRLIVESGVM